MKVVNSDIAYSQIRKGILNGTYRPGQPLMTKELSVEIGVSRTPVRDALRQLEADGLVVIRPHLGASVRNVTFKEFREMCDLRLALESTAAGMAAENRTPDELRELKLVLENMRELTAQLVESPVIDQAILDQLRRADVRFHICVISAAKNELLKKEVIRMHIIGRVVVGLTPGEPIVDKAVKNARRTAVQQSHDEIYEAIAQEDAPAAKLAMEKHISDIIDTNLKAMSRAETVSMSRELSEEELSYSA